MATYSKLETDDKGKILSMVEEAIEDTTPCRIYTQKLDNGNYCVEIISSQEEPATFS